MDVLVVSLFFVPGFITEYLYTSSLGSYNLSKPGSSWHSFLRGLFFNVPLTIFTWLVIWFWKVVLGRGDMIYSLSYFWSKAVNQDFILKYCLVLLVGIVLLAIWYRMTRFYRTRSSNKQNKAHNSKE